MGQVLIYYLRDNNFFSWWPYPSEPSSLYADDIALLAESSSQLALLTQTIQTVGAYTGLHLNISKTIAFSCVATDKYYIEGIQVACKPVKYLGAFLGYGDLTKLNFEIPLKKVQNKIQYWNKHHLTLPA